MIYMAINLTASAETSVNEFSPTAQEKSRSDVQVDVYPEVLVISRASRFGQPF
jgi:hypothetical protein